MLPTPRRAGNALSTAVVLFYASAVTTATAQSQDNCVSFSSSSTAGNPEDSPAGLATFFSCADGSFLTGVQASYFSRLSSLVWTCSDQEEIGFLSSSDNTTADGSASFTIGLTGVQTWIRDDVLPFLGNMYFEGYNIDYAEEEGVSFSWKGPFGIFDADDEVLPGNSASYCARGTFATGVTVWASQAFVYGVMLECAAVTETCAPQNYPMSLVEDGSSSVPKTGGSRETFSSLAITLFASLAGGLLLVAIAVGVTCCTCRRRPRKARGPDETAKISAVTGTSVAGEQGDASANNETTKAASYANKGVPPLPSSPPPPYVETPTYPETPPPEYC